MRVLVTGGTGFVGSHVVEALHRRGDDVTVLVRSIGKAGWLIERGVRIVRGDLHDAEALRAATDDQQVVIHVAGVVAGRNEAQYFHANREGTQNLLRAAEASAEIRFVLVSSLAAAGPSQPGLPWIGDEDAHPVTAYGRSKLAGEAVVRTSRLPWTIVRPPMVFGPGDTEFLRLFQAARRGFAPVFGAGTQELSSIYGPDLADALVAAATSDKTIHRLYYACSDAVVSSAEFARAVGRAVGRDVHLLSIPGWATRSVLSAAETLAGWAGRATVLNRDKAREFLAPAWSADPALLKRDTGWSAANDLESGLSKTVAWYREQGRL